jgi:hypothetical protein
MTGYKGNGVISVRASRVGDCEASVVFSEEDHGVFDFFDDLILRLLGSLWASFGVTRDGEEKYEREE